MNKEFMEKVLAKLDQNQENFEKVFAKLEEHDEKFERVFAKLEEHNEKFERVFAKLEEHDEKFERVFAKLEEHDQEFNEISNNFKLIITKLEKDDVELREIKDYLFVFEDTFTTKTKALFDGYSTSVEKGTELELKQNAIGQKVDLDSLRISVLEEDSKRHTKQISKLLAK